MSYLKTSSLLALLMFSIKGYGQIPPSNEGVFLKAGMVLRGIGFSSENLQFGSTSFDVQAGNGLKIFFGTGIGTKFFDFELTAEQSLSFGFFAQSNNNGTSSSSITMWQTNLYATGLFKIPTKKENFFRFGAGPMLTFPGKLKVTIDGTSQGEVNYTSSLGSHVVADLMISAKKVFINPGIRLNFSELSSSSTTFTDLDNIEEVKQTGIGSLNLYMLVRF
jgi:hypothetical protein